MRKYIEIGRYTEEDFYKYTREDFIKNEKDNGVASWFDVLCAIEEHNKDGWGKNEAWILYSISFRIVCDIEWIPLGFELFIKENQKIIDEMIALGWEKPNSYDMAVSMSLDEIKAKIREYMPDWEE